MELVTAPDSKAPGDSQDRKEYEIHGCPYQPGSNNLSMASRHTYRQAVSFKTLSPPSRILGSNAPPFIHRVDFEMFLNDKDEKRLHTFTSIQSEIGSALRPLEDVCNWEHMFPHLAAYHHRQGHIDSDLILLETNLDLLRNHPPKDSMLGINPFVVVAGGMNYGNWRSTTRLYEKGLWVRDARKNIELDKHALDLQAENIEKSNDTKLVLKIKSLWWAHNVIAEILTRVTSARAQGDPFQVYQAEQWGRQFLAEMSMMQEISAIPRAGGTPQTVAILLWKFRQTRPGETATTTWRKLTPPSPRICIDASTKPPASPLSNSPVALDNLPQQGFESPFVAHDGYMGQPSFFVDDPESIIIGRPSEADSSSSTPTPDLQSLPSSTATSFASSGSGSYQHVHHSAESSHGFETSTYLSQDLDTRSQDAIYQDTVYQSQDVEYERPDVECWDQGTSYPDPSEVYRSHQTLHDVFHYQHQQLREGSETVASMNRHYSNHNHYPTNDVPGLLSQQHSYSQHCEISPDYDHLGRSDYSQDFLGGRIQISLAEREHQQNVYQHSLVAPEADMLEGEDVGLRDPGLSPGIHFELHDSQRYSASQDLENLDNEEQLRPTIQHHDPQHDQILPMDETIHRSQRGELILHHPQPHQSLQHHLDSAQWKTHALWTDIHSPRENDNDDTSPIFDTEMTHGEVIKENPELISDELQEPGRVIGEISPAVGRDIDEIERDVAREVRRDLTGAEVGD